jgi:type IX secretion system PorP/SprF family membrane protein
MFNKQLINPGYVGNEDVASATLLFRDQWNGFKGAPKTQLISLATPLNDNKIGVGLNLINHKIGFNKRTTLEGMYAYRIKSKYGTLSLGMQGSLRSYSLDFSGPDVITTQSIDLDQTINPSRLNKNIFNFGFGLYFNTNLYYIGASIPRLAQASLDFDENGVISEEFRHIYLMGGAAFVLSPTITLRPQALFKYVSGAPSDLDLNMGLTFSEKYTTAITYRTGGSRVSAGESIDLIFSIQTSPQLMFGFAYDITLSDIRTYSNGSIEVMAHYLFNRRNNQEEIINPRYF